MRTPARILVPVDGSVGSDKAVGMAVMLAQAVGAVLDILYVSYFDRATDDTAEQVSWLPDSVVGSSGRASKAILDHAASLVPTDLRVECHVVTGVPARKIIAFAEEKGDAMIVVGGRGLGLMEGFLLGSVSQAVMENAKGTVVVVK